MDFYPQENTSNIYPDNGVNTLNPSDGSVILGSYANLQQNSIDTPYNYLENHPPLDIENYSFDPILGFQPANNLDTNINQSDVFGLEVTGEISSLQSEVDQFGIAVTTYQPSSDGYESSNTPSGAGSASSTIPSGAGSASGNTPSSAGYASSPAANDWFSLNLSDQQLIAKTRSLAADGQLSRNDMVSIFRDAEDLDVIDANEYKDFQTILNNSSYFKIEDYVRVLSNKIVFGTTANKNYQGQVLGNLYAGSSSSQMEKLIDKWFFGGDKPTTSYTYQYAEGSLFKNGVSYQDISQGLLGDCYLLAALAKVAISSPQTIESMFIDNGDGTFSVRFYNNGVADYVTVNRYLPVDSVNDLIYANQAGAAWGKYYDKNNELWVALVEKAYAQLNEAGWISQDNTNSYAGITGGWDNIAITHITGTNAGSSKEFNLDTILKAYNDGKLMGVATKESGLTDSKLISNHIYVFVNYDPTTQKFTLFNPWGTGGGWLGGQFRDGYITASINDLRLNFTQWSYLA